MKKLRKTKQFLRFFRNFASEKIYSTRKMTELNDYRQELKSRILEIAMAEFSKRGVREIKMDDIAHKLHISKRTLYEIYADKESLLLEGIQFHRVRFDRMMEDFSRQPGVNVVDIVVKFFELQLQLESNVNPQFYADIHKFPRVVEFLEANNRKHNKSAADFLARGMEEGLFRKDINYELSALIGHYSLNAIMDRQLYNVYPMSEIINNFTLVLIRGFCTEKGIELLDGAMRKYR